jgi:ribosomal protein S6
MAHNGVEHRVHKLGVDQMAFGLDDFCDGRYAIISFGG